MRILHILPQLSGGGAERQFSYLASELVRLNHNLNVAYLSNGPDMSTLSGVTMHRLTAKNNYDPYILWQLIRLIQCIKPDIVHTWLLQMDIIGGVAAKLTGVPWILREPASSMAYPPIWKHLLRVWIGSGVSAIVSNSRGGDEYWKTQLSHSRRFIVPNGLPMDEIDRVIAALPHGMAKSETPIVLYVGRMIVSKNTINLLEALTYVRQKQKVLGIFCGEGPQRNELEALRHKLELDADAHFVGNLPAASVWALMKKAAVFVSLSAYEGCPNTVMEAMACGCPQVLSDIPSHHEILDESSAFFVDPSDIQQTADTIIQVLINEDASKVRAMIARRKIQEWSVTEMARNYERVYNDVIFRNSPLSGKGSKHATGQKDNS